MKDWSGNLPNWTSQVSVANRLDAMDCLSESFINIVYMLTGFDASPRALAKQAGTTLSGNSEYNVLQAANTKGLIPYQNWPSPDSFDWNLYYAPIPNNVLATGRLLTAKAIPANLNKSPLWTILRFPNGNQHGVAQVNNHQYFDSEQGSIIKELTYGGATIVSQVSLEISMNQTQVVLSKDGKTVWLAVPIATDWDNFVKQANVEGITIPNPIPPSSSL
jgi:hypothetical protein